jgi:hypothetical protein
MKKLSLHLDQLAVESFSTDAARKLHGTVRGQQMSNTTCIQIICDCPTGSGDTCDPNATCAEVGCTNTCREPTVGANTCQRPSCFNSCGDTCGCESWYIC